MVERYQYTPYGQVTVCNSAWAPVAGNASAYDNQIQYCGYRFDPETGADSVRYRIYWPNIGRWGQGDPIGYMESLNAYGYVASRVVNEVDPMGLAYQALSNWPDLLMDSPQLDKVLGGSEREIDDLLTPAENRVPRPSGLDLSILSDKEANEVVSKHFKEGLPLEAGDTVDDHAKGRAYQDGRCKLDSDVGHRRLVVVRFMVKFHPEPRNTVAGDSYQGYVLYVCGCVSKDVRDWEHNRPDLTISVPTIDWKLIGDPRRAYVGPVPLVRGQGKPPQSAPPPPNPIETSERKYIGMRFFRDLQQGLFNMGEIINVASPYDSLIEHFTTSSVKENSLPGDVLRDEDAETLPSPNVPGPGGTLRP